MPQKKGSKRKKPSQTNTNKNSLTLNPKPAKAAKVIRELYLMSEDLTLTATQGKNGQFKTARQFRAKSNKTIDGYSTGYHESGVTTDTHTFLRSTTSIAPDRVKFGAGVKGKFFAKNGYGSTTALKDAVDSVLSVADGFRVDTAQTILSGVNGTAAAHTGSGIRTTGQDAAHTLIRAATMRLVDMDPKTHIGFTNKALSVTLGAISGTSIAPAELAETLPGSMKAKTAPSQWEAKRNETKRRVKASFNSLNPSEKKFVLAQHRQYFQSLNSKDRELAHNLPFTPFRSTAAKSKARYHGGGYNTGVKATKSGNPELGVPTHESQLGAYMTQPSRAIRRKLFKSSSETS